MKYTFENFEKSQVKLTVTLDKTDWEKAILNAYNRNKSKYSVQGFRKGHVPFNVICGVYGKEAFYEDAINGSVSEYYPEILEKEKENIHPVGDPNFSLDNVSEDGIEFTALIPVMPEVKISSYKGIKVDKVDYNVTDQDVEDEINALLERKAKEVPVTDRPCQNGDIVVIDYSGSVDGVKFDGGTAEKQRLELGSGSFIPGFEDQVVGMNIDEDKDINVTFPENYTEPLNGKAAVFAIHLHEILTKELPELTDEFIKEATGEETVDAYKQKLRDRKQADNEKRAQNENEDNLLTKIAEGTEVEIPDCMVEQEITSMVQQFQYRLMYQGLKYEDYLKMVGKTDAEVRESYKDIALPRVKKQLIVNKIIEDEKIEATEEEVNAKVDEQAKSLNKETEEYKKTMDPRQFDYIKNSIVIDKLFAFLVENNDIS